MVFNTLYNLKDIVYSTIGRKDTINVKKDDTTEKLSKLSIEKKVNYIFNDNIKKFILPSIFGSLIKKSIKVHIKQYTRSQQTIAIAKLLKMNNEHNGKLNYNFENSENFVKQINLISNKRKDYNCKSLSKDLIELCKYTNNDKFKEIVKPIIENLKSKKKIVNEGDINSAINFTIEKSEKICPDIYETVFINKNLSKDQIKLTLKHSNEINNFLFTQEKVFIIEDAKLYKNDNKINTTAKTLIKEIDNQIFLNKHYDAYVTVRTALVGPNNHDRLDYMRNNCNKSGSICTQFSDIINMKNKDLKKLDKIFIADFKNKYPLLFRRESMGLDNNAYIIENMLKKIPEDIYGITKQMKTHVEQSENFKQSEKDIFIKFLDTTFSQELVNEIHVIHALKENKSELCKELSKDFLHFVNYTKKKCRIADKFNAQIQIEIEIDKKNLQRICLERLNAAKEKIIKIDCHDDNNNKMKTSIINYINKLHNYTLSIEMNKLHGSIFQNLLSQGNELIEKLEYGIEMGPQNNWGGLEIAD